MSRFNVCLVAWHGKVMAKKTKTGKSRKAVAAGSSGRLLLGLLLAPFSLVILFALIDLLYSLPSSAGSLSPAILFLALGYFFWLLLFFLTPAPVRAYVLAHELTHALWALLWGARVGRIRVTRSGGSVALSHTNALILLAPYFFPLYTMMLLVCQLVLSLFLDVSRFAAFWMAGIGFTWGFHFTFTLRGLMQRQSDITACGRLFSYSLILIMNLLGIGIWVSLVSEVTVEAFLFHIVQRLSWMIRTVSLLVSLLARQAESLF